jgi:hypothetical protein
LFSSFKGLWTASRERERPMADRPTMHEYYSLRSAGTDLYRALDAVLSDVPDETEITIRTHFEISGAKNRWDELERAAPTTGTSVPE